MRFLNVWTTTTLLLLPLSQAQNTNTYTSDSSLTRALSAFRTLQKFYSPSSGLYTINPSEPSTSCPSCWWQSASTLTTLSNLLLLSPSLQSQISPILQNTYSLAANSSGASNWLSGNYDDVAWWGLAWIAAYDATGQQQYLETAEAIFEYLKGTWGTRCGGGGMWWSSKRTYVNAITNELVISLSAKLANRSAQGKGYGKFAEMAWTWFANSGMIDPQGLVNDGLDAECKNNGQTPYTYTQGVVLEALAELYRYTNREYYLDTAYALANASMAALTDGNGVVVEACEREFCDADQGIFKGVYVRGLMALGQMGEGGEGGESGVIGASAGSLWERGRGDGGDEGLIGVRWTGPFEVDGAGFASQSSGLDCLVADTWVKFMN